jgi:hypothetical protein
MSRKSRLLLSGVGLGKKIRRLVEQDCHASLQFPAIRCSFQVGAAVLYHRDTTRRSGPERASKRSS